MELKYVIFGRPNPDNPNSPSYVTFVIFPHFLEHSSVKVSDSFLGDVEPVSAGFCFVVNEATGEQSIKCWGNSTSLGLKGNSTKDSIYLTRYGLRDY